VSFCSFDKNILREVEGEGARREEKGFEKRRARRARGR
jgi:hypothetical protein